MEGIVVDRGQRAGRSQQLNHDPPAETSYPVSDWLGAWHIDVRPDLTCPPRQPFAPRAHYEPSVAQGETHHRAPHTRAGQDL